jgi:excisionase family DNA binding protein
MDSIVYDLVKAVNKAKDKLVELTAKVELLSKSPSFQLSQKYVNETEACRILRVCNRVLAQLRADGEIPYYRVRKRILYQASDLQEYLEKKCKH